MAKLFYKPFGIVAGLIASRLAAKLFDAIWQRFDPDHVPGSLAEPTLKDSTTTKAVGGAALQAATFAASRAVVDRAALRTFEHLTGAWAGAKPPKRADDKIDGDDAAVAALSVPS